MLKLTINQFEKKRLLFYADQTLSESLHWGNGAVIILEEQILLNAIKESKGKLTLNSFQLELLLNWLFDATGEGHFLLGEDISIINKIIGGLTEYHRSLKNRKTKDNIDLEEIEFELNFVEKMLKKLIYMLPETEKKEEIDEVKEEITNRVEPMPKVEKKEGDYRTEDTSLLDEKIKKVAKKRGGIEEYKKELINKFRKERYEKKPEEKVKEGKELKEGKEDAAFEEKVKRAKVLRDIFITKGLDNLQKRDRNFIRHSLEKKIMNVLKAPLNPNREEIKKLNKSIDELLKEINNINTHQRKDIKIDVSYEGNNNEIVVITPHGLIDHVGVEPIDVEKEILKQLSEKHYKIIVHLPYCDYVVNSGWGAFLRFIKDIRQHNGDLVLADMSPDVLDVYKLMEFSKILKSFPSLQESISYFCTGTD